MSLSDQSSVVKEDGIEVKIIKNRAIFDLLPASPLGPVVLSPSHLNSALFYKDSNVTLEWNREINVSGYSYSFNSDPQDIPDNVIDTKNNRIQFEDVKSGAWYFHIKQMREGLWGETTHLSVRVDTVPPEPFNPQIGSLSALIGSQQVVSFATIDKHSGVDHYEIAVVDKNQAVDAAPLFIEAKSPYKLSTANTKGPAVIIVRAYDKAGNIREEKVSNEFILTVFLTQNWIWLVIIVILSALGWAHMRSRHSHKKRVKFVR